MITKCPVCGKVFDVLWPQLWAYREGNVFMCTWKCLRKARKESERMESKRRDRYAVADEMIRMMEAGQDPIVFLKSLGYINPAQAYSDLRTLLKKTRPEMFKRLPENLKQWKKKPEIPEPVSGGPWEKLEVPEGIVKGPVTPDELFEEFGKKGFKTITDVSIEPKIPTFEYKVTCIETAIGTFQYFKSNRFLDWTDLNGETVSMNLEEWKEFMKIWPEALKVLGVEL